MTDPEKRQPKSSPTPARERKGARESRYDKQVEGTFPASDPPAESQPGGGITGPEQTRERHKGR